RPRRLDQGAAGSCGWRQGRRVPGRSDGDVRPGRLSRPSAAAAAWKQPPPRCSAILRGVRRVRSGLLRALLRAWAARHRDGICPCRSVPGCDRFRHSKSRPLNTTPAPDVGPSSVRQHWSVVMRPAFCHSWYRAICAFTVLLTACDGGGGGEPTGPSGPLTLQPARPEYATFESARASVPAASRPSSSYPGTLGATSIRAQRTGDSTVVLRGP